MIHTGWPFPGPLQSFRASDSYNDDSLLLDIEVSERESRGTTVESQSAVLANAFKLSQVKKQLTFIDLDLRRTGLIFYLNCTYSAESVSSDTEHYLFDYTFRLKKGSVTLSSESEEVEASAVAKLTTAKSWLGLFD